MAQTTIHETMQSRARKALNASRIRDLCDLTVECKGDQLVISGSVSRYYYKQLAQELVLGACGQICLINAIDVR